MDSAALRDAYCNLLIAHVANPAEGHLVAAAQLGHQLVLSNIPPEEVAELQEFAMHRLAETSPAIRLGEVTERMSGPFMEMAVAYGLAFRERDEARRRAELHVLELNEELEQRVTDRTAELQVANEELEAFSYSVSHDLRAPLRALDGFSGILLNEHTTHLAPDAQRYLGLIRESAQNMGQLIDGLLTFSRLSRQPLSTRTIDPSPIVEQQIKALRDEHKDRSIDVAVGPLPACEADPVLLTQVFANLIGNAFKYTSKRDGASVEVGCQDGHIAYPDDHVYFVKDNGVGFDMRYADKLFGVFQRLHRAEDFEGTGVGLAIVARIVHRHGGNIWADSVVDQGTTFYFTLGEAKPNG